MSLFEDREQAFENMFAHEENLHFRARARRNRRLALWAAARLSLLEDEADSYEMFIVRLGVYFGDDGVRERILHDLNKAGVPVSEHRVRRMMDEWLAEASAQQVEPRRPAARPMH